MIVNQTNKLNESSQTAFSIMCCIALMSNELFFYHIVLLDAVTIFSYNREIDNEILKESQGVSKQQLNQQSGAANNETRNKKVTRAGITKKQWVASIIIVAGILVILAIILYLMIQSLTSRDAIYEGDIQAVSQYDYNQYNSGNGFVIHVLKTKPANIKLEAIHNNVTLAHKTGINGGFFYQNDLLSIALYNGTAVNGHASEYGSGGENTKYARGTLVWDGLANELSVQVVQQASDLKVKDYTRFWAQGGISMNLQDDQSWLQQAKQEEAPFMDSARLRSGIVFDKAGMVYLIVSETKGTTEQFRTAIKEVLADAELQDGIFLDGDGSSQLLAKERALPGDSRAIVQMIRIVK